jgi:dolichol-phosphate mannosyltransferase
MAKMKKTNNIAVIIPTYNAKEAILFTIKEIIKVRPDAVIFIVDDNSPDGTATLVQTTFYGWKNIVVLKRKIKNGRGSAVVFGLKHALQDPALSFFVEMDSDLCHDPIYITELTQKCLTSDVVIASRYLKGSKIIGWNMKRKIMSKMMNLFAKSCLRIPITDYTNGYRCYSRKAAELLCSHSFISKSYVVLSESAFLCYKRKMNIAEIPIVFTHQSITKSNLDWDVIREAIRTLLFLRINGI